jgi:hypothetical protein
MEELYVLVRIAPGPALLITFFNPSAVLISDAIAFVAEGFRLFFKLLARVNDHHPSAMVGWFLIPQEPKRSGFSKT